MARTAVSPSGWGKRHTLALLGFTSWLVSYSMRFNLSLTIVAMVQHKRPNRELQLMHMIENGNSTNTMDEDEVYGTYCEEPSMNKTASGQRSEEGEFAWTEAEQGLILGSFFWGYFVTQLPGGLLAQKFGGKWVIGIGLLVASIGTLLTPVAARAGKNYLIIVRVIEGLGEGVHFPAGQVLLAKWIPTEERSKLSTIVYSGLAVGAALTMFLAGLLTHSYGWPSVFYVIGVAGLVWFLAWAYFIHETPDEHPNISVVEKAYIHLSAPSSGNDEKKRTPWCSIVTSLPVLGIVAGQIAFAWGLYTLLAQLPTYLKTALHFDIKKNGLISASPYLFMFVLGVLVTSIADKLVERKVISTNFCRKLCNTIACWGAAAALVAVSYTGCNTIVTIVFLNLAAGLIGVVFGGCPVSTIDVSPNYAGIIAGIANSFANICGFFAPYVAGLLINKNPSIEQWRLVFFTAAGFLFVGNLCFLLFGSSIVQPWNSQKTDTKSNNRSNDKNGYANGGFESSQL